ncbi:MAG: hypothetical protein HRU13_12495 [Phycisphaerales bacterium]|nr:hypothetical protein [Phycisphaerales bacterium]
MDVLEQQLKHSCAAMRGWDGVIDLPTNALLVLKRDRENVALLGRHRDLALEVLGRVMDVYCQAPLVREAAAVLRGVSPKVLLGFETMRQPARGDEAVLVRELTARFVEAGVGSEVSACA